MAGKWATFFRDSALTAEALETKLKKTIWAPFVRLGGALGVITLIALFVILRDPNFGIFDGGYSAYEFVLRIVSLVTLCVVASLAVAVLILLPAYLWAFVFLDQSSYCYYFASSRIARKFGGSSKVDSLEMDEDADPKTIVCGRAWSETISKLYDAVNPAK